jgi:hypothetical protein
MAARRFKALQISIFLDSGGFFLQTLVSLLDFPFRITTPKMWRVAPVFLATIWRSAGIHFFNHQKNYFMSITNWDEVLPAFDRAFEEMRKVTLQSKETALKYLKEAGFLDPDEEEEKAEGNADKSNGAESAL